MADKPAFTKPDLETYLRQQWLSKGCELADDQWMGVPVEELLAHSEERNSKLEDQHFDLWIAAYHEFVSWLISLVSIIHPGRKTQKLTEFEIVVTVLLMRIIADSFSMRILMLRGFDTTARVILRSTSEHIEMLVAIISDPTIAPEFAKTRHPNTAAAFWKKHVKRGGLQRRMKQAWTDFFKGDVKPAKWFANWGSRDHQIYSANAHPSMFGCLNAVLPWKKEQSDEKWLGFWGDRSLASIDTIHTYLSFLFPMLLIIGDFPFGKSLSAHMRVHRYNSKNELHRHVRHGRSVLGSLIMSLNKESNIEHVYPPEAYMWNY